MTEIYKQFYKSYSRLLELNESVLRCKTFFTADPHFDHPPIIRHARRNKYFKDIEENNQVIKDNWNRMVKNKNDTVYIIGDFAYKNHEKHFNDLNGRKVLIEGNHDSMPAKVRNRFREFFDFGLRRKFRSEFRDDSLNVSRHVVMCHYAMSTWESSPNNGLPEIHFYGHSHGRWYENEYQQSCDVGVDTWGFHPVPFDVLRFFLDSKKEGFNAFQFDHNEFKLLPNIKDHNELIHLQALEEFIKHCEGK